MTAAYPDSKGKAEFLKVDLADLNTIKPAVQEFLSKETRLDVLTNNAGVMTPPSGSKDAHGRELQLGTNVLGPFLFTQLLTPIVQKTAKDAPTGSVRVTWASSLASFLGTPKGGIVFDSNGNVQVPSTSSQAYGLTKVANILLASEFAKLYGKDGIISVSWNPGNLTSELQRHTSWFFNALLHWILLYPTIYGGYTELYSGWSTDITESHNGAFIAPWGRIYEIRDDLVAAQKNEKEGGTGEAERLWAWCAKETKQYA